MTFNVPFIKIACNEKYYWLMDEIPRKYSIYCSINRYWKKIDYDVQPLCCVPKYPAEKKEYKEIFNDCFLVQSISDHTVGLDLWHEYHPEIFEKHYVLHKNKPDNPDSGEFSVTPEELSLIL